MCRHFDNSREQSDKEFDEQFKIDSMEQLTLTEQEFISIGFIKKLWPKDELNKESVSFEIPTVNGCFYYNPHPYNNYVWYQKTVIGDAANHIHLNIENKSELFLLLACFQVKYNVKAVLTPSPVTR